MLHAAVVSLLLWALQAGNINCLLHGQRPAAAWCSAANVTSVTFTAVVEG